MQLTNATMRSMLADLVATGAIFDPAATYVAVYNEIGNLTATAAMSDVTQATAGAATRVAVTTWDGPFQAVDGSWYVESPLAAFGIAGSGDAQAVSGWMLASASTAGVLKAFKEFTDPIGIPDQYHPVQLVVRLVVDPSGNWDSTVIVSP